jgi:multicomponent Na+:H+ antiporter subunit G
MPAMTLTNLLTLLALPLLAIGTTFSILGVLGYLRFPDVYTRLHAAGKVGVLGVLFLLLAGALIGSLSWGRALLLIFFLFLAGPLSSHVLASAAWRMGLPMSGVKRDDLAHTLRSDAQPAAKRAARQ